MDHAEQLGVYLSQSAEVLNKNWDIEGTDVFATSQWDNRSPPLLITKALRLKYNG